ncbi:MAG: cell division protein FtsL [Nannocystaceae bacterium]
MRTQPREHATPRFASVRQSRQGAGAAGFDHGRVRASDRARARARGAAPVHPGIGEEPAKVPLRVRRPGGLALFGLAALVVIAALAGLRVRTQARILELGEAISDATAEHSKLIDEKRRLEAERAYLRHPDHIQRVATQHLGMERPEPESIQRIRVDARADGEERRGGR